MSLSPTKETKHCLETGLLLPQNAKHAFFSSFLFAQYKEFTKSPRWELLSGPLFILSIPSFVPLHYYLVFKSAASPLSLRLEALGLSICFVLLCGGVLRFSLLSRRSFLNKIFQIDILVMAALLGKFVLTAASEQLSPTEMTKALFSLNLAAQIWILLRFFEAWILAKKRTGAMDRVLNKELYRDIENNERISLGLSVLLVSLIVAIRLAGGAKPLDELSNFSFYLILGLVPFFWWKISQISSSSNEWGVWIGELKKMRLLKSIQFFRSHFNGVFTKEEFNHKETWIDPSSAWSEKEILSLAAELAQHSTHPLSRSLASSVTNHGLFQVRLADVHEKPHLGLFCKLRNDNGQLMEVSLSHFAYLSSLGEDCTSEGQTKAEEWTSNNFSSAFLSINGQIVGGFSFEAPLRKAASQTVTSLQKSAISICLLSSQDQLAAAQSIGWNDSGFRLLPFERELQIFRWNARNEKALELRSSWDKEEEQKEQSLIWRNPEAALEFEGSGVGMPSSHFQIFSDDMRSLCWLVGTARIWNSDLQRLIFGPALLCLVVALLTTGMMSFYLSTLIYLLFLLWIALKP